MAKSVVISLAGFVVGEMTHPFTRDVKNNIPENLLLYMGGIGFLVPNNTIRSFSLSLILTDLKEIWRQDILEMQKG